MRIIILLALISEFAAATELSFTMDKAHYRLEMEKKRVVLSSEAGTKIVEIKPCANAAGAQFMNKVLKTVTPPPAGKKADSKKATGIAVKLGSHHWKTAKDSEQGKFLAKINGEVERLADDVAKACK